MSKTKIHEYIFTFGYNHKHPNCFIAIMAESYDSARNLMYDKYGSEWAFQYHSREEAGVEKYNLTEIF